MEALNQIMILDSILIILNYANIYPVMIYLFNKRILLEQ